MPYRSKAQAAAMHAKAQAGEISQSVVNEFDAATDFSTLPKKKKKVLVKTKTKPTTLPRKKKKRG